MKDKTMSVFGDLKSEGMEDAQDRIGGGFTRESGIAIGTIKVMYAIKAASGARGVHGVFQFGKDEYEETFYVTNKKGENWFLNKQDPTKKIPLPGWQLFEDICFLCTEKQPFEMESEDKMVNVWDPDSKSKQPKSVPVFTELTGQPIALGIIKQTVNKNEKGSDGTYVATAETRDENFTDKAFHPEAKLTVVEAKKELPAAFWDAWSTKNNGVTRDKTTFGKGAGVKAGTPGAKSSAGAPVANGASAQPRKSLFGNKQAA